MKTVWVVTSEEVEKLFIGGGRIDNSYHVWWWLREEKLE